MSHWHTTSCTEPHILVREDGVPECGACDSIAPLEDIIARHEARGNPALVIPPDEPAGQLKLRWPPCIPWSDGPKGLAEALQSLPTQPGSGREKQPLHREAEGPGDARRDESTTTNRNADPVDASHGIHRPSAPTSPRGGPSDKVSIYPRPLKPSEIRLLRLDAATHRDDPVHGVFEVYDHDDCPEYETVSYTWTNEDGTSTPWKPVYVGDYWNVTVNARNCWSLLCYLRPRRGARLVWIDALCINQADNGERQTQVARMGEIYLRCMRAVVWLGDDIVQPSAKTYRPRRDLKDMSAVLGDQDAMHKLLERKYFKRVWIIQELVLAPESVIPVHEVDFYARVDTARHGTELLDRIHFDEGELEERYSWEYTTPTPWLADLHRARMFTKQNLHVLLDSTWHDSLQATDPRDRIFGILGLCSSDLMPDYSISLQSTLLGTTLYILLHLKFGKILTSAGGVFAKPSQPSWTYHLQARWPKPQDYDRIPRNLVKAIPVPSTWQFEDFYVMVLSSLKLEPAGFPDVRLQEPRQERYGLRFPWPERPSDGMGPLSQKDEWHSCISVSREGALSMKLAHLSRVMQRPLVVHDGHGFYYLAFQSSDYVLVLSLFGNLKKEALDEINDSGTDHLFLMKDSGGEMNEWLLMVMRETPLSNVYRLISCCVCCNIRLLSKNPVRHRGLVLDSMRFTYKTRRGRYINVLEEDGILIPNYECETFVDHVHAPIPWRSLGAALEDFEAKLTDHCLFRQHDQVYNSHRKFKVVAGFHQLSRYHTLSKEPTLALLQALLEDELAMERMTDQPRHERFARVCLEAWEHYAHSIYQSIRMDGEYFYVKKQVSQRDEDFDRELSVFGTELGIWDFEIVEGSWKPVPILSRHEGGSRLPATHLRAKVHDMAEWCKCSSLYMYYTSLAAYSSVTGESVPHMLARGAKGEDKDIFPRIWPQPAVEQLGLDERLQQVWIV